MRWAAIAGLGRFIGWAKLLAMAALAIWAAYERNQHLRWRDYAHRLESASQAAKSAQEALRAQEALQSKEHADATDQKHSAGLAGVLAKSARYSATHRVQPARDSSPAVPIDQTGDPQSPVGPDPQALVAVTADDVEVCSVNTARLIAAQEWAKGL